MNEWPFVPALKRLLREQRRQRRGLRLRERVRASDRCGSPGRGDPAPGQGRAAAGGSGKLRLRSTPRALARSSASSRVRALPRARVSVRVQAGDDPDLGASCEAARGSLLGGRCEQARGPRCEETYSTPWMLAVQSTLGRRGPPPASIGGTCAASSRRPCTLRPYSTSSPPTAVDLTRELAIALLRRGIGLRGAAAIVTVAPLRLGPQRPGSP